MAGVIYVFKYLGKKHILRFKSNLHEYFDL